MALVGRPRHQTFERGRPFSGRELRIQMAVAALNVVGLARALEAAGYAVSARTISRWLVDDSQPPPEALGYLTSVLGCRPRDLRGARAL